MAKARKREGRGRGRTWPWLSDNGTTRKRFRNMRLSCGTSIEKMMRTKGIMTTETASAPCPTLV